MATLKTLLACFAANQQQQVLTPKGVGTIQSITLSGGNTIFCVDLGGYGYNCKPEEVRPVLKNFTEFRQDAYAGQEAPKGALALIANAVLHVKVAGKQRRPQPPVVIALDASLSIVKGAKGYGRIDFFFTPYWNPLDDPTKDPEQWQPVLVPGLADYLLKHGYAAGLPIEEYVSAETVTLLNNKN